MSKRPACVIDDLWEEIELLGTFGPLPESNARRDVNKLLKCVGETQEVRITDIRGFVSQLHIVNMISDDLFTALMAEVDLIEREIRARDSANRAFALGLKVMAILRRFTLQGARGKSENPVWGIARKIKAKSPEKRNKEICVEAIEEYLRVYKHPCPLSQSSMEQHFKKQIAGKPTVKR